MDDWLPRASDPTTPGEELRRILQAADGVAPSRLDRHLPHRARIVVQVRRALAGNPNAPFDLLQRLVVEHPASVLDNVALPLILMVQPDFWDTIGLHGRAAVLRTATISEERIRQICPTRERIRQHASELLRLPATPQDILASLLPGNLDDWHALVVHAHAPEGLLTVALEHGDRQVRWQATRHPRVPAEHLGRLRGAGATAGLEAPGEPLPPLPEDELLWLARRGEFPRLLAALNPASSLRVLETIGFGGHLVCLALVNNPQVSPGLLDRLVGTYSERERSPLPGPLVPELIGTIRPEELFRCAVARHPLTMRQTLERLANETSTEVRAAVALHPMLPSRSLSSLGLDDQPGVVREALKNPALGAEIIDVIVRYQPPVDLCLLAARHPNTSRQALASLAQSEHAAVREAARIRRR